MAVAATGFKSLVSDQNSDYRILVHDDRIFKLMALAPGVVHAPTLVSRRGAARCGQNRSRAQARPAVGRCCPGLRASYRSPALDTPHRPGRWRRNSCPAAG